MKLARENVVMLQKYKVFAPHSHPKLQSVDVWFEEDKVVGIFSTHAARLQFLLDIGPGAAVRVFSHMSRERCIPAMLSLLGNYPGIQVLCLLEAELNLWDAIVMVKSLPLLSDMHVQSLAYGQFPSGVSSDEFPAYVLSQYEQMSDRFRCCHISHDRDAFRRETTLEETVTCVLLLALVCPNLNYCASPQEAKRLVKDIINSGRFSCHKHCLQRFLSGQ
ncbi:hypothetical protein GGI00_000809 [Coemansia sp. RSA 2681]|nr:hypothetical protein GGI00_000809 [Coemansia sp. RSA 2681]